MLHVFWAWTALAGSWTSRREEVQFPNSHGTWCFLCAVYDLLWRIVLLFLRSNSRHCLCRGRKADRKCVAHPQGHPFLCGGGAETGNLPVEARGMSFSPTISTPSSFQEPISLAALKNTSVRNVKRSDYSRCVSSWQRKILATRLMKQMRWNCICSGV